MMLGKKEDKCSYNKNVKLAYFCRQSMASSRHFSTTSAIAFSSGLHVCINNPWGDAENKCNKEWSGKS
jgi:hypothetical protein